jgi:adenosine/AMP kinase
MDLNIIKIETPNECNLILGTAHFIKTVEDLYECLVNSVPNVRFGLSFCESSGSCLIRSEGNDDELQKYAVDTALRIGAGHSFIIFLRNAYPINVINAIKNVPEVCTIHCATANPVQVLLVETEQGRGILGIIDGSKPKGVESQKDVEERKAFIRKIGYKL